MGRVNRAPTQAWSRLLDDLERHAQLAGAVVVHLETNGALTEAIALYRQHGYREGEAINDEPSARHWFEKRLASDRGAAQ